MIRRLLTAVLALALVVLIDAPAAFAQTSYDGRLDIGELMNMAARRFDTAKLDAVLLADGMTVTIGADGRLSTLVHRVIRLNTDASVDKFGDTRIPFDQEHCTFTPLALRVWRDGRWWNTDSSGFVETLPFALEHAYDYTGVREMMLLASAIEVPCILEMAYRVDDRTPFRPGADDLWLFGRDEACVQSWFELRSPAGLQPRVTVYNGAPASQTTTDQSAGLMVNRWQMGPLNGWPIPKPANLAVFTPCLIWSSWPSGDSQARFALGALVPDSIPPMHVTTILDSLRFQARNDRELTNSVVALVRERMTPIDYPITYWWSFPRSVRRVYESAYAHRLDRARLVASLIQYLGLKVTPALMSESALPQGEGVPGLNLLPTVALRIQGSNCDLWYYPASDRLEGDLTMLAGKSIWRPGTDAAPRVIAADPGLLNVRLGLSYDKMKAKFLCSGSYEGTGIMPGGLRSAMATGGIKGYLSNLIASVMPGATVTDWNPERIDSATFSLTFVAEIAPPDPDPLGRTVFTIGKPKDGAIDRLPSDLQLYRPVRTAPVILPATMTERLELRVDSATCKIVRFPSDTTVQNSVGSLRIQSQWHGTELLVVRELMLTQPEIGAEQWPALRTLVLAYTSDKGSRFYLKLPENSTK